MNGATFIACCCFFFFFFFYFMQCFNGAQATGWIVSGVVDPSSPPPCQSWCINVYQNFQQDGHLFLYRCMEYNRPSRQQWSHDPVSLALSIDQTASGNPLCMQASEDANLVILNTCNNGTTQQWTFEREGNRFRTGNPASPLYLQANSSSIHGTNRRLFVSRDTNGSADTITQFTIIPMSSAQNIPALPANNASNLIRNGGFDNVSFLPPADSVVLSKFLYSICGWIVESDVKAIPKLGCSGASSNVNFSIDLGAGGAIAQRVPTYRGSEYLLLFQLSTYNTCDSTTVQVHLEPSSLGSPQVFTLSPNKLEGRSMHLPFVALGRSLNLSFQGQASNVNCTPVIDNVELYMLTDSSVPILMSIPAPDTSSSVKGPTSRWLYAALIMGWIMAGCVLLSWYVYQYSGRRKPRPMCPPLLPDRDPHIDKLQGKAFKRYSLEELRTITKGFTDVIGEGGFATVCRAEMTDGTLLAVKREVHTATDGTAAERFQKEISMLLRVHHRCIVNCFGYCDDEDEHLLVFEYMPNGSLDRHLHERTGPVLPWTLRMRIAFQVASGLEYLHHWANPAIVHRDVKSANILLAEDFSAKVADFGISKVGHGNASRVVTSADHVTRAKGTPGYIDPEYHETFVLTEKSDVYSFGVVLLELVSGRKAVENNERLDVWATKFLEREEELHNLVDESLEGFFNPDELRSVAEIASMCVKFRGQQRPQMFEVVKLLRERLWVSLQSNYAPVLPPVLESSSGSQDLGGALLP